LEDALRRSVGRRHSRTLERQPARNAVAGAGERRPSEWQHLEAEAKAVQARWQKAPDVGAAGLVEAPSGRDLVAGPPAGKAEARRVVDLADADAGEGGMVGSIPPTSAGSWDQRAGLQDGAPANVPGRSGTRGGAGHPGLHPAGVGRVGQGLCGRRPHWGPVNGRRWRHPAPGRSPVRHQASLPALGTSAGETAGGRELRLIGDDRQRRHDVLPGAPPCDARRAEAARIC
jgi:hypothetical protein